MNLSDEALTDLYKWVDSIPLSKPKKNITRDFSDGVQVAEIVKHFFPKMVELFNFRICNNTKQKMDNWELLNRKVFCKLRFELDEQVMRDIANSVPGVLESFLDKLRTKIDHALWHMKMHPPRRESDKPEADQVYDQYGSVRSDAKSGKTVKIPTLEPFDPYRDESPQRKGTQRRRSPTRGESIDLITSQNLGRSEPFVPPENTLGASRPVVPYFSGQPTEAVSLLQYQGKCQESLTKEETIGILEIKIRKLEHLLHLKDLKIEDLQGQINHHQPTVKTKKPQKFH
ncbi:sperm flagellar protein 1-like isoform X3 [Pecten maximus]|uniref:sperm flagellar protein 1-like isoform X3 n=1 Tax=Pecten maximus TaxID=6579 RepID=UPI001458B61C|nr:sperm flagellar protein 1-like isoform X3 [Pecten maximus]